MYSSSYPLRFPSLGLKCGAWSRLPSAGQHGKWLAGTARLPCLYGSFQLLLSKPPLKKPIQGTHVFSTTYFLCFSILKRFERITIIMSESNMIKNFWWHSIFCNLSKYLVRKFKSKTKSSLLVAFFHEPLKFGLSKHFDQSIVHVHKGRKRKWTSSFKKENT